MEKKIVKKFIYKGLGFPIVLTNVPMVKRRDIWTPAIDYNKLQRQVLLALSQKPAALTGNEIHFIRTYFEMTLENFGKLFGVSHVAVLNWEKREEQGSKITPATELYIRLLILEKLHINNQIFRCTFRGFDMMSFASEQKSPRAVPPLTISSLATSSLGGRLCGRA